MGIIYSVKMKKIIVVVVLAIFLMTIPVSATELEIYPETVEIDLVGGDFVQVNITVSWSGSYPANCELTTYIEPDGEGINITYSRNNFTMEPSSDNNIMMFINASLALMPGTYIITTDVNVEMQEQPSGGNGNGGNNPHTSGGATIQDDDTVTEPDDEEPDDDEDEIVNVIYYTITPKDDLKKPFLPMLVLILGLVVSLVVLTLLYVIIRKRRRGEKNDKNK